MDMTEINRLQARITELIAHNERMYRLLISIRSDIANGSIALSQCRTSIVEEINQLAIERDR